MFVIQMKSSGAKRVCESIEAVKNHSIKNQKQRMNHWTLHVFSHPNPMDSCNASYTVREAQA